MRSAPAAAAFPTGVNRPRRQLKGPGAEGVACRDISSHTDDRRGTEGNEDGDQWGELGLQTSGAQSCRPILAHTTSKTQRLTLLAREDFDHREGVDVLGGDIGYLSG